MKNTNKFVVKILSFLSPLEFQQLNDKKDI